MHERSRVLTGALAALLLFAGGICGVARASGPPPSATDASKHDTPPSPPPAHNSSSSGNSNSGKSGGKNDKGSKDKGKDGGDCGGFDWFGLVRNMGHVSFPRSVAERIGGQIGTFSPAANDVPTTDSNWGSLAITYSLQSPRNRSFWQPNIFLETVGTDGEKVYGNRFVSVSRGRMFEGLGFAERAQVRLLNGAMSISGGAGTGLYYLQTFHHYSYAAASDCGCGDGGSSDTYHTDHAGLRTGYRLFAEMKHRCGVYLSAGWYDAGKMNGLLYRGTSLAIGYRH